jgi:ribosomal protein S27AE
VQASELIPVRNDVERLLGLLSRSEAKLLEKRDYQRGFETIPVDEEIVAAVPVVFQQERGALVVTASNVRFVSGIGGQLYAPLDDVLGVRYTTGGSFSRKPYQVYVNVGGESVEFGMSSVSADTLAWFIEKLETSKAQRAPQPRPPVLPSVTAPLEMSRPGAEFSVADELAKLARLVEQGVLTEDEFLAQKARVLGMYPAPTGVSALPARDPVERPARDPAEVDAGPGQAPEPSTCSRCGQSLSKNTYTCGRCGLRAKPGMWGLDSAARELEARWRAANPDAWEAWSAGHETQA